MAPPSIDLYRSTLDWHARLPELHRWVAALNFCMTCPASRWRCVDGCPSSTLPTCIEDGQVNT
jgi:hypothetical protein